MRLRLQVLAGILGLAVLVWVLAALLVAAQLQGQEDEFFRFVTQREIDDAVAGLIRDARDDFERGGT
jgi:hypothetical protein